jgi:hypothetical protein
MHADSKQADCCSYLSAILLGGLLLNALFGWWWMDPVAGLAMVPIIGKEGISGLRSEACCGPLRASLVWSAKLLCVAGETMGSMRRRSILLAAGAAVVSQAWKGAAQTSLGTLTWVEAGSLWTRELPDGRAVKIVSGDGLHSPRFSPLGRWLAYRNRHDKLSVVRSDGQSGASLEGSDAVWFPRDDRLAVTRGGDVSVFAPEDGWKSPTAVVKGAGLPLFGPDGERFVFGWDGRKSG